MKTPPHNKHARITFIACILVFVFVASVPSMPLSSQAPTGPTPVPVPTLSPTSTPAPMLMPTPVPVTTPVPMPTSVPMPVPMPVSISTPAPITMPTAAPAPIVPTPASTPIPVQTQVATPAISPIEATAAIEEIQVTTEEKPAMPTAEQKKETTTPPATEQKPATNLLASNDQRATIQTTDTTTTATTQQDEQKEIYLNFENADLTSFIEYIAELKKFNIIPDKALEGSKISLTIREPLSVEGAYNVFLTVLEMAGFSIIKVGVVHKIIPKDKKLLQPLPAYINVPCEQLPDSDLTIRYVTFLANINVTDIQPLLESMLSQPNAIHAQKDMNAFVITDKSYNIKAAVKLIQELDQMGLPESVTVLRLKRANASDVKNLFDALIKKPADNPLARLLGKTSEGGTEYFSPTTRIIAEERTNSLILLGNNKSIDKIIDFITKNVDTDIKEAASPLHIYELQHIDAKQVADILKEVTVIPDSPTGQAAGKFGSIRGGVKYFRNMNFQVDKDGNRLIVSCIDKQDWKLLKKTLQDLDKPQPQVAIETMLVTITSQDIKELGGMIRNKKHGQIGRNIDAQSAALTGAPSLQYDTCPPPTDGQPISLLGNLLNQLIATKGQTLLTFGNPNSCGIWGVFHMIKDQTNASILSQPFLTVANKTKANIEVGRIQRVISEKITDASGTTGYIDTEATTKLELTPQINLDGVIQLKVKVDITEFENTDATIKSERTIDTAVNVADGQVLILGGFVKTKVDEAKVKTPILGDIPILGWFFKNQNRTLTKEYIFMFLSPTIIKPRQTPGMQLYTKMKLHQATDDIENSVETKQVRDPIHNWYFNPNKENYSHKVIDFANARYQPTTVDIKNDPYYHATIEKATHEETENDQTPTQKTPTEQTAAPQQKKESLPHSKTQASPVFATAAPSIAPNALRPSISAPITITQAPLSITPISQQIHYQSEQKDDELTQRRNKLKELLATSKPITVSPQPQESSSFDDVSKRNALKQFLGAPTEDPYPTEQPQQQAQLNLGYQQRNTLKDFLSASGTNKTNNQRKVAA